MKGDALIGLAAVIVVEIKAPEELPEARASASMVTVLVTSISHVAGMPQPLKIPITAHGVMPELLLKLAPATNGESIELIVINETLKNCSELCH